MSLLARTSSYSGQFSAALPRVALDPEAFAARHRVLRVLLWLHLLLVGLVAVIAHPGMTMGDAGRDALVTWAFVACAFAAAVASTRLRSALASAVVVSLGLLMCADALVHGSGGQTDMHFDFFVVLALISLYQDWVPFALAVLVVAVHHLVLGILAPTMVFSSPQAQSQPVRFALLHTAFVLAMSAVQIAHWRFTQRAEEALRVSVALAERLALVARVTDNAVVIADAEGRIEWVNDAFTRITGHAAEHAVGRLRQDLLHGTPEEVAAQRALFAEVARGTDVEFGTCALDGRRYRLDVQVRPIVEDGVVVRYVGVERDVTARYVAAEQERALNQRAATLAGQLSEETAILTGVLSAIPQLVYWKDEHGRYAGANDAFLAGRDVRIEDLLGRSEADLTVGGTFAQTIVPIEGEVRDGGRPVVDRHVTVLEAGGRTATLLVSVLPQPGSGGWIGVGADVTHISDLERQLAQAHRLETVGQLAAGIAHEINTPVQFVSDNTRFVADSFSGLVEALAAAGPSDSALRAAVDGVDLDFLAAEVPTALAESLDGLQRIAGIVRALKDFSHPGQERAMADLNRAVESTVQVCRNEWKYVAQLELDLDPAVGLVPCHEGDLKQAVLNVVVNAAHAVAEQHAGRGGLGRIRVSTRRVGECVEVVVSDDGAGMDERTRQRIFDPFFTTKPVGRGTGQGLSQVHATVVQKHAGNVAVRSAPGEGSTFTFTLPAPRADCTESAAP